MQLIHSRVVQDELFRKKAATLTKVKQAAVSCDMGTSLQNDERQLQLYRRYLLHYLHLACLLVSVPGSANCCRALQRSAQAVAGPAPRSAARDCLTVHDGALSALPRRGFIVPSQAIPAKGA